MIVGWTGHRPDLFRDPALARARVESAARELSEQATRFLVGGQRGVDTWAALTAIACGVGFDLVLPCELEIFTRDWAASDRVVLVESLRHAAAVRVAAGYSERNQILARQSDLLVAVWTRTAGGGTAETIDLARQAGTAVREIILEPSDTAASAHGRGI
ncbi:MAG: hypothetical protein JO352_29540 [Chloroflexi bacterium]|nr:hypothetical protein [Chloroflexota bacterium]MBV9601807.1 hypothetical protein [Chloroflexota bacterium]